MFGYKLGDTYQLTSKTRFARTNGGHWMIVAERADKPAAFHSVKIGATPLTRRIVAINGYAEMPSRSRAEEFASNYAQLLTDKLQGKCVEQELPRGYALWLNCKASIVTVTVESGTRVWISSQVLNSSELRSAEHAEVGEYMAEQERRRLANLRKDKDANRGL